MARWDSAKSLMSLMVQEKADLLLLGWGSRSLLVLFEPSLVPVPGKRALSEHLLNEWKGGRVPGMPPSAG